MKRYRLVYRSIRNTYYSFDTQTNKRESLGTGVEADAQRLIDTKNEAVHHAEMNLQIAQVYLQHSDPTLAKRTWQDVMEAMTPLKSGPTLARWKTAMKDAAFDTIRKMKLMETNGQHFLQILKSGTVSTNMFLRRIHNFAVGMHWLPWPVLPKLQWPRVKHGEKRAITADEHARIIERERNPQIRAYYEMLWHLGGSQTDIAELTAGDIDWTDRTVAFQRNKTAAPVLISFGQECARILANLPKTGALFPMMARLQEQHRGKMFTKRLTTVGIVGVSLHSYRYSWAERALTAGVPERFAQSALGHGSKAVARAYARKAKVIVPSLEDYERKIVHLPAAAA